MLCKPVFLLVLLCALIEAGYFLLSPPFQSPDEFNHFYRSYQLAGGSLRGEVRDGRAGGEIPEAVVSESLLFDALPFHAENKIRFSDLESDLRKSAPLTSETFHKRKFREFPNTVLYSPVCYVPQVIAIVTARIFQFTILESFYLARVFNFLFLLGASLYSFYLLKKHGLMWLIYFTALLTPMAVFQANSVSPDVVTLGLSLLLVVLISVGSLNAALLAAVLLALCKSVYFPLSLLAIPAVLRNPKLTSVSKKVYIALFAILPFAAGTLWLKYVHPTYVPTTAGADPEKAMAYLFSHLAEWSVILFKDLVHRGGLYFKSGVGVLGWMDVYLPRSAYWMMRYVLFVFLFLGISRPSSVVDKASFALGVGLTCAVIFVSVYLSSNAVGAQQLDGVFGRYFLPVVAVFGCSPYRLPIVKSTYVRHLALAALLVVVVHFQTLWALYNRYWLS